MILLGSKEVKSEKLKVKSEMNLHDPFRSRCEVREMLGIGVDLGAGLNIEPCAVQFSFE